MKERPIIFKPEMVRAILEGRKTQTRRVVQPQPAKWATTYNESIGGNHFWCEKPTDDDSMGHWPSYEKGLRCPYGQVGERLWVREAFMAESHRPVHCRADGWGYEDDSTYGWTSPLFMPRWASRLVLEITSIRVERVQDISEEDAKAEGVTVHLDAVAAAGMAKDTPSRMEFWHLWNSIHGKDGHDWDANPWVWVVGFQRLKGGV